MATYVNDLRLKEIGTGESSGTWGSETNTNLELIGEALGFGTQDCFSSDADASTTVADGATDPARAMYFKVTSSATLSATRTLTIAPNTISRVMFIENATTGSQSIAISQGTGANVTIPTGDVKAVYLDGAGAGAAVADAFANLKVTDPAQTNITSVGTLTSLTVDNIAINDNTISNATASMILDSAGDINLDADGGDIIFKDDGTAIGHLSNSSSDFVIESKVQDKDIIFKGDDGGSVITAMTIDMSDAGTAIFNHDVKLGDNSKAVFGASDTFEIFTDGTDSFIKETAAGSLKLQGTNIDLANAAGTELGLRFVTNDAVTLYYDADAKLATTSTGIDVTGTVTADGLTVVDTGSDAASFKAVGGYAVQAYQDATSADHTALELKTDNVGGDDRYLIRAYADASGTPTENFRVAASGEAYFASNVGIGTSSPANTLDVFTATSASNNDTPLTNARIIGGDTANVRNTKLAIKTTRSDTGTDRNVILNVTDGAGNLRNLILDADNVGIGTTSPSSELHIEKTDSVFATFVRTGAGSELRIGASTAGVGCLIDADDNTLTLRTSTAEDMIFETDDTERMRVLSTGGLTFNGDTAAANALDDYEEGTWRPEIAGQTTAGSYTYGENAGQYVKIGNQVTATFYIVDITEVSAGSGNLIINNLPFTAANVTAGTIMDYYWGSCNLEHFNVNDATVNLAAAVDAGTTVVLFWETLDNNVNGIVAVTDLASSGNADVWGQVTYRTT